MEKRCRDGRKTMNDLSWAAAGISVNSVLRSVVQECAKMNRSAKEPQPAPFATPPEETTAATFHFGSGKQYSTSVKQKKCIIQRSQTQPALFGLRAQSLSRRLSA
jgi:hypothetical protein